MKNIVIRSGSLRMGGIERILMEVLQGLNTKKYRVFLIIEDNCGKNNIFQKDIPQDIPLYFLKEEELILKTEFHKQRKNCIYHKILYNYYMWNEHMVAMNKTKQIIDMIKKQYGEIEAFVDYDWGARRYIEKIEAKRKIIWLHSSISKLLKKNRKIKRFGKYLEKYDKVVTICDEMKGELLELYPKIKNKIYRVYNPFNFLRIKSLLTDESELSEEQKQFLKEEYIVSVARLDSNSKDFETLINAYEKAVLKGINEKLYIVGDGPDREKIEMLVKEKSLENKIRLIGKVKNPYIWMKNANYFVHSSKFEGLPTVLIEALICGKIVISSNCPTGPKEILENGEVGFLFPVGNEEQLANILLDVSKGMKKISLKRINEKIKEFESEKIIAQYERIILEEK